MPKDPFKDLWEQEKNRGKSPKLEHPFAKKEHTPKVKKPFAKKGTIPKLKKLKKQAGGR